MTKEEKINKLQKFVNDPDWVLLEDMIHEYIEPLRDIDTIDISGTSDSVMADVAGRQKAYKAMTAFLRDCRILGKRSNINNNNFK